VTTDFQHARSALGLRLRELRTDSGLTGRQLAEALDWPQSKVSKLETGRQTATAADLTAWAEATGRPDAAQELTARPRGMESRTRAWRRQSAHQRGSVPAEAARSALRRAELRPAPRSGPPW
jgi:transcriptional regulator with XRE-family HTH domain